jgi:hypothetical protein
MVKVTYITYATGKKYLEKSQEILSNGSNYFDKTILYTIEDIDDEFYKKNEKIFNSEIGAGYWLWKPYLILKTLEQMNENEIVFYLDLGDFLHNNIKNFVIEHTIRNGGFFLVEGHHINSKWTKKDCLTLMDCDSDLYKNSIQLEAGCCAFQKNEKTIKFVKEWLFFCQNYDIVSKDNILENESNFIEHRYDQSILTNLSIKNGLKTVSIHQIFNYITYNHFF